jgi:hypothetical protein
MGWINVRPETKQMVVQWFVRADLEAFFRLFNEDADERRFNYWMRFIKQISYSYIMFSKRSLVDYNPNQKDFLKKNKGRYGQLKGSTSYNNAFMIRIGNIYIVEFSKKGNAAYRHIGRPQYSNEREVDIFWLRADAVQMKHIDRKLEKWEERFDTELMSAGISAPLDRPISSR